MATAAILSARSSPLAWLQQFLRDELAPYPGRAALVSRMVLCASIAMLINMTFQIPYGAYAALYALTISRENPEATLQDLKSTVTGLAIAGAYVLLGAIFFSGGPILRLIWVLASLFLIFWVLSALANYKVAVRFGYLVAITTPLWDQRIRAEQKVVGTLWAIGSLSLAYLITAVIELIYARLYQLDNVTTALVERLQCTAAVLRSWSAGISDQAAEQKLTRLATLGTSRMRRDLLRSDYSGETTQKMGAVVSLVGRLVDLAANLTHFPPEASNPDRPRLHRLMERIGALATDLLNKRVPEQRDVSADAAVGSVPLLVEMEQTVSLMTEVLSGYGTWEDYRPLPALAPPRKPVFLPDAFSNPDHVRFAIRGGLAAGVCYLSYNLIAWQGISTAVATCFVTALTTVGASRQKQILRFSGALIGGVILGFGAQIFILPGLDSIAGFLVLFLAVTFLAAWISSSGPRLSYLGVQIAISFYLINLQEFKFQTSLAVARDRVAGIFLGLLAMWLIFDQLWGASAAMEMKRSFDSTLRLMANLMREPVSMDQRVAIERSRALRETINSNFNKLRQQADGVVLEFGPSRESNLALRDKLLRWQLQLRGLFIARIALLKYRLRLPGFELPEPIFRALLAFDMVHAERLDQMADYLQGNPIRDQQNSEPLRTLKESIQNYTLIGQPPDALAARLRSLLALSRQIEPLLASIEQEILAATQSR